ncbi:unnamed protein product [Phytophthora fragariaefolia]|uniref:Unnamed protein product n=1 Tax=Phytophthora fragariaefolia TaxID=1490495 RepID=A0A9W7CQ07_9STRA|nr:unnamed protein product [Phytophthora fragariaefolia]
MRSSIFERGRGGLDEHKHIPTDDAPSTHSAPVDLGDSAVDPGDEEVCIKESGDLYAEDVEGHPAVLPEITPTTEEVKVEDIQVGNPNDNTQVQVDRLKHIIWRRRHLLIGKGNALPPPHKGRSVTSMWEMPNRSPNGLGRLHHSSARSCFS